MVKASILFVLCLICTSMVIKDQDDLVEDFSVKIHKVIPPLSIERHTLSEASRIQDLHRQYKSSWVKEFIEVEIQTIQNGKKKIARSENDILTKEQIINLSTSDFNTDIYLKIDYIPNNSLKHNEPKTYDATFRINPDKDAEFAAGDNAKMTYLLENVVGNVANHNFEQYALAAVKFTVDKTGRIENVSIKESSKDDAVDQYMVDAICNMPAWNSAEFYDGTQVDQDFVLTVGNMESCIVPTLNIKRY